MFGSRGKYLEHFELTIPEALYKDWHRCFVFHKLALAAINGGKGSPTWIADNRISAASSSSIDKAHVEFDRGEMSWGMFNFSDAMDEIAEGAKTNSFEKLDALRTMIGESGFPNYLLRYVKRVCPDGALSVAVHRSQLITKYAPEIVETIERKKGFLGDNQLLRAGGAKAIHHFRIIRNPKGKARLFYKFEGSVQFIKNLRRDT